MFWNSLWKKLAAAFAVVWLGSVVVGVFAFRATHELSGYLDELAGNQLPSSQALARLQGSLMTNVRQGLWATVALQDADKAAVATARIARDAAVRETDAAQKEYTALPMHPMEEAAWKDFQTTYNAWRPLNEGTWVAVGSGDPKAAVAASKAQAAMTSEMLPKLRRALDVQAELGAKMKAGAEAAKVSAERALWLSLLASAVLAAAFGTFLTLAITRPLEQVTKAAAEIAKGDLRQRVEHQGADEVGALAESFRSLIGYLEEVARAADALSQGDVDASVTPRSDRDVLAKNFLEAQAALRGLIAESNGLIQAAEAGDLSRRADAGRYRGAYGQMLAGVNRMVEAVEAPLAEAQRALDRLAARDLTARADGSFQGAFGQMMGALNSAAESLQESLAQVSTAADQVASASTQIASSSQAVAQGASEQASALEETSSALVEMSGNTKRNAQSAATANGLVQEAETASSSGQTAMTRMSEAMQKIRASAEGTAAIIRDINEIAFQTNLLALNAAVEAARAGEAGRGFAVVAEEVRNLALRSKEAAKKTEALIGESMSLSQNGEEISRQVSGTLSEIVTDVGKVASIVGEITRVSEEQAQGIEQVNKAMSQMDSVTQAAAANSEESSSAAEELASQAQELRSLVSQFQLGQAARVAPPPLPERRTVSRAPVPATTARKLGAAFKKASTYGMNGGGSNGNGNGHARSLLPLDDDAELRDF